MTNDIAPLIPIVVPARPAKTGNYPAPGTSLHAGWQAAWEILRNAGDEYVDGNEVADKAAEIADIKATTMIGVLTRAATEGILERTHVTVEGERGPRRRTHYRIPR